MTYADQCEIIEPLSLRQTVFERAMKIMDRNK